MLKWITANPLWAGLAALVLIVAILGGIKACTGQIDKSNANLVNQGATEERAKSNAETINAVANAQRAADQPTANQLNVVCGKYDRNCQNGS